MSGASITYRCPVPADYLLRCSLALAEAAALTIGLRVGADGNSGTLLTVHAAAARWSSAGTTVAGAIHHGIAVAPGHRAEIEM